MPPACAGGGVGLATTMGALYTGRGPVCGITTRRGATAGRSGARGASGVCGVFGSGVSLGAAGASFAFAAISAACPTGASTTGGAGGTADAAASTFSCTGGADGGATTGAAAFGAAGFAGAADSPALGCACVAPAAGVTGGFTTTVGGTTVTWADRGCPCRRLGHNSSGRRLRRNGRCCGRNNRRCRPRLRHNLARFRPRGSRWRCCNRNNGRRGLGRSLGRNRSDGLARRHVALAGLGFLFLLLGQNGLHHVAGLGDMGEINLGCDGLRSTRRPGTAVAPLAPVLEVRADLFSLVIFDRTRVSFALTQAEFPEHVKNLTALDFHLTREIVNSNLAHPPLFRMCYPKPFSRA